MFAQARAVHRRIGVVGGDRLQVRVGGTLVFSVALCRACAVSWLHGVDSRMKGIRAIIVGILEVRKGLRLGVQD